MLKTNLTRTVMLTALMGTFALVSPMHASFAQDATNDANDAATAAAPSSSSTGSNHLLSMHKMPKHMHGDKMMDVESRIKSLHDKLKVTDAQETEWTAVAQAMRDNETQMHQLIEARHQDPDSMTAVDDLQSYQQIAQAHADGLSKMITAFQTLYGEMSDDQKKNADVVFGRFEGHRDGAPMKHHHKAS